MSAAPPTLCILPWIQMIVETDGRVLPCCVADVSRPLGNVRRSRLEAVWNSETMRRIRRNMLAGRENPECAG
ncbi:MAG: SPASM domain-containing protein, partial [Elusimicrobia bacterium]|nr:SPASM domain-containing protein [Elusimicrobiota bacterium]